jgi:hypothetical protein
MDRKTIAGWLWMKSEDVVQASLDGFDRGEVIVVPGWQYRAGAFLLKHLPHAVKRRVGRPGGKKV